MICFTSTTTIINIIKYMYNEDCTKTILILASVDNFVVCRGGS